MKRNLFFTLVMMLCFLPLKILAQETIFAGYFDIPINSPEGTEVIGRIHLERNKDVLTNPIPEGYNFEILKQKDDLFELETRYDLSKRIMGVFKVKDGQNTGDAPSVRNLTVALKDGNKQIQKFNCKIRIVKKTLWATLNERYTPTVINNSRLYGKTKYSDDVVAALINELDANDGRFEGEKCYTTHPKDYQGPVSKHDHWLGGTIEYDWMHVANRIGGLGYAYATSKEYGPQGDPIKHEQLKQTLYKALLAYMESVSVEGSDVLIDGKPIGNCTGDGFSLLNKYKWSGHQIPTHQWVMTDPLIVPILHLMPDLINDMHQGNETGMQLHNAIIRYFQVFTSIVENRRAIDNPNERWGEIQDTLYSAGAWADANLGHRSRTMLAMPIIWADYNRPMTYVQYWYKDFYKGKPFEGFSFSPGWSPHGVVADIAYWMTKNNVLAHKYVQSGFQPDGTISHHTGQGTDAALVSYGFEWLTDCNAGYQLFKNTPFEIDGKYMQFQLNYLLKVYPKLFYKQRMDFLVSGRAFDSDLKKFVKSTYIKAVNSLLKSISKRSKVEGVEELKEVLKQLKTNTYEYSGTDAYWVNEYLVHRRGENETPFFASLKLKSERTVGAEDFDKKVRRSWHMGSGILQVKVKGDEYSEQVLQGFDWHALPGLTEEWRIDPLPVKGGSQASLPGQNKIAGVLSDGISGMGIYHHLPKEKYSSATAFKSYHFIEDRIVAQGSGIARYRDGQGQDIATFIDQSALMTPLVWCVDGNEQEIAPEESINLSEEINTPCWIHEGDKGYIILPQKQIMLNIKTGKEINVTDRRKKSPKNKFIIALNHGKTPGSLSDNSYCYLVIPNVTREDMPERMEQVLSEMEFNRKDSGVHAVFDSSEKNWQYAFFRPDTIAVGGVEVASDDIAQLMLREEEDKWVLSVNNPAPDGEKQTLTFYLSMELPQGTYTYQTRGLHSLEGETVSIVPDGKGCTVTVELPDKRDAARYNYQSDLYAATPIVVNIPK